MVRSSVAEMCVEKGCKYSGTILAYGSPIHCPDVMYDEPLNEPCDTPQSWGPGQKAIQCCCTDTK